MDVKRAPHWRLPLLLIVVVSTMGIHGGIKSETPTQRLYGVVTVRYGTPPNELTFSGFIFGNHVLTAYADPSWTPVTVSFANGTVSQKTAETFPADGAHVTPLPLPTGTKFPSISLLRLPVPLLEDLDGPVEVSRAQLPAIGTKIRNKDHLQCYGYGNGPTSPTVYYNSVFRTAEFIVHHNNSMDLPVKGVWGESLEPGDSGGPCFQITGKPASPTFVAVGIIFDGGVQELSDYVPLINKAISQGQ